MTNAFDGDYCDFKPYPKLNVCKITIEIPLERGEEFVRAFGLPNPSTGVPVAIARLQEPAKQEVEKPSRKWSDMLRSQQAGIAANDPDFARFLESEYPRQHKHNSADAIRAICGIHSRRDLDNDENLNAWTRWDTLYSDYVLWKRGAAA